MKLPHRHTSKKQTLKRKLLLYMCVLASLLCILLFAGMFIIGNFTDTKTRVYNTLSFQAEVFERQIDTYYDGLAVMSVQLSNNATDILEGYLSKSGISFKDLNGSQEHIENLQNELIGYLNRKLWEADCTGAFIMLEAQVNPTLEGGENSRTGIYLQRNSLEETDTRVLLYRGLSQIGKENDCMPHRKWRLEFSTELFPNYEELKAEAIFPLHKSYRITDVVLLPGTDQHVMLMTVPLLSDDGTFYGLCGFEINEGYFKTVFAQPSELDHAVFCISKHSNCFNLSEQTLNAGILNKYYLEPQGSFCAKSFGGGLTEYSGNNGSYIGITKEISLCPSSCTSALSVLIPKNDYDNMLAANTVRIVMLIAAFSLAAILLALLFTRRYLTPLRKSLDNIRKKEYEQPGTYPAEISDLFEFLSNQDRLNEEALNKAKKEKAEALAAASEMQTRINEVARQNERLAYSRKEEIDPYDYENFKSGIKTLTEKEREIFNLYLSGKTAKEITEILDIRESTLKFHNHNILAKLGVPSRKQMLRYAALLETEIE